MSKDNKLIGLAGRPLDRTSQESKQGVIRAFGLGLITGAADMILPLSAHMPVRGRFLALLFRGQRQLLFP